MKAPLHFKPSAQAVALYLVGIAMAAFAAPPAGAPELEKLRASYKAAVAKGTKPVLQAHITNLEKLRDIYARGSNLTGAAKVQADIDRANLAMATGESIPPAADSNNAATPELDKLRERHEADVGRAIKPYRETYVRELGKLRDNYTRAADLVAAMAAQTEFDAMKSGGAMGTAAAPATMGDDNWFVGRSWWTYINSEFHFKKGGSGMRTDSSGHESPFTWRKAEDGVVEASGTVDKAPTRWFFKFVSRKEGFYGNGKQAMTLRIRDEK